MKNHPLNNIKIASPCSANWNEMCGNERKRFCSLCNLNVYNLSAMTQAEAENLILEAEGRMCLKLYRRSDGTVITQNCPVGLAKVRKRISQLATATFGLVIGVFSGLFGNFINSKLDEAVAKDQQRLAFKKAKKEALQKAELEKVERISEISFSGGVSNLSNIQLDILMKKFPAE